VYAASALGKKKDVVPALGKIDADLAATGALLEKNTGIGAGTVLVKLENSI
jgi:hypothetical protein